MEAAARSSRWLPPDRLTLWVCLTLLVIVCWMYLLVLGEEMRAMAGARNTLGYMWLMPMGAWGWREGLLALAMWIIMMVGMMTPSIVPVLSLYEKIQRKTNAASALRLSMVFVGGYLAIWAAFSVAATGLQYGLTELRLYTDFMQSTRHELSGALLILAGIYQFTPWKSACLTQCQSPVSFLARHWRGGVLGALRMGAQHGTYCLGCCWLMMLVLFAVGVMNLLWIALLSGAVLAEKLIARPGFSQVIGVAFILLGAHEMHPSWP